MSILTKLVLAYKKLCTPSLTVTGLKIRMHIRYFCLPAGIGNSQFLLAERRSNNPCRYCIVAVPVWRRLPLLDIFDSSDDEPIAMCRFAGPKFPSKV